MGRRSCKLSMYPSVSLGYIRLIMSKRKKFELKLSGPLSLVFVFFIFFSLLYSVESSQLSGSPQLSERPLLPGIITLTKPSEPHDLEIDLEDSEIPGSRSVRSVECSSEDKTRKSSSIIPCNAIHVMGAGSTEINGVYQLHPNEGSDNTFPEYAKNEHGRHFELFFFKMGWIIHLS